MLALGLETHATRSLPLDVDYEMVVDPFS